MSQQNPQRQTDSSPFAETLDILSHLLPALFVGTLLLSLARYTPWVNKAVEQDTSSTPEGSHSVQLKLTDLSSGAHLLKGNTLESLKDKYFGLIIVYKPEDAESESIETYNNIKVVEALGVNGEKLARVGSNTDSLVLLMDSDDFQAFARGRPTLKNLYLVEQGSNILTATPTSTPDPVFTPIPTVEGMVIFDLLGSDALKSDMNQFRAGDEITIIISTQSVDTNGNTLERRSTPYAATIIGVLDNEYLTLSGPPYSDARVLRISINRGIIIAFTNDLSGAVTIHLISRN